MVVSGLLATREPVIVALDVFEVPSGHVVVAAVEFCLRTIPSPCASKLGIESALKHLHDERAEDWEELPCVKGASGGDKEVTSMAVRSDDPVRIGCGAFPG